MTTNNTLNEFAVKFAAGDFNNPSVSTQIKAGWYDWFCTDAALQAKTVKLGKKAVQLMKSPKINPATDSVMFKNNCPVAGSKYDDLRIIDADGDVKYTIVPSSGFSATKGQAQVYGIENQFQRPLVVGKWADVKKFFGV